MQQQLDPCPIPLPLYMALCRAIADPLPQAVWRALTAEPVAARAAARGALSADCAAAVSHIYICVVGAFFGVQLRTT
jgi:hypothetical protein